MSTFVAAVALPPRRAVAAACARTFAPRWRGLLTLFGLLLALRRPRPKPAPRPDPPRLVNDLAHLLQPAEADALEHKLVAYNDSTSSQIAVVTVPTLDGDDIADYAQKLYESWGIGRKGKNNGILVLVAQQEHTGPHPDRLRPRRRRARRPGQAHHQQHAGARLQAKTSTTPASTGPPTSSSPWPRANTRPTPPTPGKTAATAVAPARAFRSG